MTSTETNFHLTDINSIISRKITIDIKLSILVIYKLYFKQTGNHTILTPKLKKINYRFLINNLLHTPCLTYFTIIAPFHRSLLEYVTLM